MRLAPLRDEEGQVISGCGGNDRVQVRVKRYPEASSGFLLSYTYPAVSHVLLAHAYQISGALPGIERKTEGEASLRADSVLCLKGGDLVYGPRMPALRT